MSRFLVDHVRRHVVGYLALTVGLLSLGGAAYASFRIPNGSVGERQIKNHVIDPVKWDQTYVTGFVRRWATIGANGALESSSPGGQSETIGTGDYVVTWGDAFGGWCAPIATVIGGTTTRQPPTTPTTTTTTTTTTTPPSTSTVTPAYAEAKVVARNGQSTLVAISTFSHGRPAAEPVSLAVVCGPGAGGGAQFPTAMP